MVGLAKHAGKTECLNYILGRVGDSGRRFAVTSIGVDGEGHDISSTQAKPEIEIYEGMMFVTSEAHYRRRRLVAEILDVGGRRTALGRLVTARAVTSGKVLLSGPADTGSLARLTRSLHERGADTVLIDGALSRLSPASPAVAQAIVLVTGAAVSTDPQRLAAATRYVCELIGLPLADEESRAGLSELEGGMYALGRDGEVRELGVASAFSMPAGIDGLLRKAEGLYVAGALNDTLLQAMAGGGRRVIVHDFTRVMVSPGAMERFCAAGGTVEVLDRSRLLAVCVNPVSPTGVTLDSAMLRARLSEALGRPVYDVRNMDK